MAPILKEVEAPVATANSTASANVPVAPHTKPAADAPARPQPVALEIPVTVNGARTADGSDKREPFSESSQTVLVFPLGAVIRITTPLAPGQLVFLTNEKTKKEVVCQVVKSKSAGSGSNYVELQFTESATGFWGLLVPSSPATPTAPRAVASPVPKAISPTPPVAVKPVAPKPIVPASPVPAPQPTQVHKPEPAAAEAALPTLSVPPVAVTSPAATPVPEPKQQPASTSVEASPKVEATPEITHMPLAAKPVAPVLPLRDFSKEIDALFAVPQAPEHRSTSTATAELNSGPASASPSSDELKHQTVRLQEQLSSLLFTETPAVHPPTSASPESAKKDSAAADVSKKVLEFAQDQTKSAVKHEPAPVVPARKAVPAPLAEEEEVRIPAWLAPISQGSNSPAVSSSEVADSSSAVSVNSEESFDALVLDAPQRSGAAVFGGQLLGESAVAAGRAGAGSSKKGLWIGLAAAVILALAGGGWYYWQNLSPSSTAVASRPSLASSTGEPAAVSKVPAVTTVPTPAVNVGNSAPAPSAPASLQPAKNTLSPAAQPPAGTASEVKTPNSAVRNTNVAEIDSPKKPELGEVHLAAPVVNRNTDTSQGSEVPTLENNSSPVGADPLADVHRREPAVPLPVGGDVKPAQLVKSVPPVYPALAKSQRLSGSVQIDALIDASGSVASMKVLSGPPVLHKAALDAVKQWKYSPALLDGEPTSMHLTVTVQFRNQ